MMHSEPVVTSLAFDGDVRKNPLAPLKVLYAQDAILVRKTFSLVLLSVVIFRHDPAGENLSLLEG